MDSDPTVLLSKRLIAALLADTSLATKPALFVAVDLFMVRLALLATETPSVALLSA
ncbi:MAG TPA: hypothetical protein VGP48_02415 [Stellaceae bacterium]|jgi:hypothetical protein|nr:hypothetical protein [Stellaceae bacterium]